MKARGGVEQVMRGLAFVLGVALLVGAALFLTSGAAYGPAFGGAAFGVLFIIFAVKGRNRHGEK